MQEEILPVCPPIDIGRLKGSGNPFRSIASGACEALLTYGVVLLELKQRSGFGLERGEKDEAAVCDACGGG